MVTGATRAAGTSEILRPGEIEMRDHRKKMEEGVDFDLKLAGELVELLKKAGMLPEEAGIDDLINI